MPVQNLFAQLAIRESHHEASFSRQPDPSAAFEFALCRNQVSLGDVEIDQFWMPIPSLYGQRKQTAVNQHPIVEYWWALCGDSGTQGELAIQETYFLAKILPNARSHGSRRVFIDSCQSVPGNRSRRLRVWTAELDRLLTDSRLDEYDEMKFQRVTGDLIGPPIYGDDVQDRYEHFRAQLFDEVGATIREAGTASTATVLRKWQRLIDSIGKHRGNHVDKLVLDILSYECRAALHRCYSAVWSQLLVAIAHQYGMSEESIVFHQLWHFDLCRESDHPDQAYFHLFHGHIFGLHPACGPVLLTQSGGEIFAEWLRAGTLQSYRRVLHALAVAIAYYGNQYNIAGLLRKGEHSTETVGDMIALEEQQEARRRGKRIRHRPVE